VLGRKFSEAIKLEELKEHGINLEEVKDFEKDVIACHNCHLHSYEIGQLPKVIKDDTFDLRTNC